MARFCSLFSGSSGNSIYIGGSDSAVLVDAGRSCRQLLSAMAEKKIDLKSIRAILVTHEHTDHISGLRVLLSKLKVPVYASPEVLAKLQWDGVLGQEQEVIPVSPGKFNVGSLEVESIDTPHDSVHSLCYKIVTPDGRRLAVATDMGYLTKEVKNHLIGCDLVMLESNYEAGLLSVCDYPYYLKRRIASNVGHLSNEACANALAGLVRTGTTRLILGHLSQNSNTPENAWIASHAALDAAGMQEGIDYSLQVASRSKPSEMVVF